MKIGLDDFWKIKMVKFGLAEGIEVCFDMMELTLHRLRKKVYLMSVWYLR